MDKIIDPVREIVDRIIDIIEKNKVSGVELGELLGLKKSPLTDWRNGQSKPTLLHLFRICENFGVSADYLLFGKNNGIELTEDEYTLINSFNMLTDIEKGKIWGRLETYLERLDDTIYRHNSNELTDKATYVHENHNVYPLFKTELWGDISAGDGIDAIPNREIIDSPVKCDFALSVKGDSMEPVFKNGSVIYLIQSCEIQYAGEIAAVQIEDVIPTAYLKKVYIEEEMFRLVSINSHYKDILLPADKVRVLGKVIYPIS